MIFKVNQAETEDQLRLREEIESKLKLFKRQLKGVLSHMVVDSLDNQSHRLIFHFHIPYVDDALVWNDPADKSQGYKILPGKTDKEVCVETSKKHYKIRQL